LESEIIKKGEKYVVNYFWNPEKQCVDRKYSSKVTKDIKKKQICGIFKN